MKHFLPNKALPSQFADSDSYNLDGIDETTWMDVIKKMDEVYSQLVADETALEQKNEALEQSQQFIFSLLSSMSDILVACNQSAQIEETNSALCQFVGLSEAELHAKTVYDLLADADSVEKMKRIIDKTVPDSHADVIELNFRNAVQPAVPVDVNCTPRLNSNGKCVGYVIVGRPMGEIKRAYRELSETHEALKKTQKQLLHSEKMASLGRLVAGVAHELNNPISFVLGNVHALKRYSERLSEYVSVLHAQIATQEQLQASSDLRTRLKIDHVLQDLPALIAGTLEGAQRTTDIVNGLKRFSAPDREERVLVDVNGVIERAVHWVSKGAAPNVVLHWQARQELRVLGNSGQLLQVMMNLVQNAYDALSTAQIANPQLWITAEANGPSLIISVRDNGTGIFPDQLSQIFDPFFTTKPVGKGTGLGLSISYGLIEQHGGKLSAQNCPEGGAEFLIELPRVQ